MPGSSAQWGYQVGVTLIAIGPSFTSNYQVSPPRTTIGMLVGYESGGTLCIVNALGSSSITGTKIQTTERISLQGPMTFFLAASGATAVASVLFKYSSGFSQLP